MDTKQTLRAAAIAAALLLTAGCGAAAPTTAVNAVQAQTPAPATAAPTAAATGPSVGTFGDTLTGPDGVAVTVTYVGQKTALSYGANVAQVFTIRVRNGGKTPIDASTYWPGNPSATYGADGIKAPGTGWDTSHWANLTTILPGEAQTWEAGFLIPRYAFDTVRLELAPLTQGGTVYVFKGAIH